MNDQFPTISSKLDMLFQHKDTMSVDIEVMSTNLAKGFGAPDAGCCHDGTAATKNTLEQCRTLGRRRDWKGRKTNAMRARDKLFERY